MADDIGIAGDPPQLFMPHGDIPPGSGPASTGLEGKLRSMILNNSSGNDGPPPPGSKAQSRKRPNQAQRRQLSNQLAVAFDPRPPLPHTEHPYVHHGTRRSQQSNNEISNRPQSTSTFRPLAPSALHGHNAHSTSAWRARELQSPGRPHQPLPLLDALPPRRSYPHHSSLPGNGRQEQQLLQQMPSTVELQREAALLEDIANNVVAIAEIELADIAAKEAFRQRIEVICQNTIGRHERSNNPALDFPAQSVQLKCFGSLSSGFATKASDMDLGLFSLLSPTPPYAPSSPVPRLLEKAFLDSGLGARLITRTRVPIIKLCERPTEKLRLSLVEERQKWEKEVLCDHGDVLDEEIHEILDQEPVSRDAHRGADTISFSQRLDSLRQGPRQSLSAYYGMAKRVLRQLDGRDVRNSNISNFTERDFNILTDVCRQYVKGLADADLRGRLEKYPSLAFPMPSNPALGRSLMGVNCQVEGELLIMSWDSRIVRERNEEAEDQCQSIIHYWKELCSNAAYGLESLVYNKELQQALDRIRNIPSLQIRALEQAPHESAVDYYSRTCSLIHCLGTGDASPTVLEYYINGIRNEQVRVEVSSFARQLKKRLLPVVALRHKILHLAADYQRALEHGQYGDADREIIREYISLLRAPVSGGASSPVITPAASHAGMIRIIRSLPDPSNLACNQARDRYHDKLEFPSSGIGVQCDINFGAHLALQNTILLRCYSHTDPRVRPLVLFVKHWAKIRNINEAYRGTLNSYGYVLMMLHYLVNVAEPFVCPNLQELGQSPNMDFEPEEATCRGCDVRFWRDEATIKKLAAQNMLNQNQESVGMLLRGFFEYFAERGPTRDGSRRGFDWGRDVLSLRTHGGLVSKQAKGWTGARTVVHKLPTVNNNAAEECGGPLEAASASAPTEVNRPPLPGRTTEIKEVRHRYLFAIEDPFEIDHNVARTVTHNGIVAIRDEFRRAWRLIQEAGRGNNGLEELLENKKHGTAEDGQSRFESLLVEIHGNLATR